MAWNDEKGGRPPKYKTTEELIMKIDEYFDSCKPEYLEDKDGNPVIHRGSPVVTSFNRPSIAGLAHFLGYESRQSIYDNEKGQFSYVLKRARLWIEKTLLDGAMDDNIPQAVAIFLLKQFGYQDKVDLIHTGDISIGKPPLPENADFPE